jgi:hypothetical protein
MAIVTIVTAMAVVAAGRTVAIAIGLFVASGADRSVDVTVRRLVLDSLVDFFAVHADFAWRFDADSNLITLNTQDRNINVIADDYSFSNSPGQNQHSCLLPLSLLLFSSMRER